jgi:hypothetical protein
VGSACETREGPACSHCWATVEEAADSTNHADTTAVHAHLRVSGVKGGRHVYHFVPCGASGSVVWQHMEQSGLLCGQLPT